MKKKFIWLGLSVLLLTAMLLASCSTSTTTSTSMPPSSTTTSTSPTTTNTMPTTTATTTIPTTSAAVTGNWWDSLGTPQYGGTITIRDNADINCWDPYYSPGSNAIIDLYTDHLTEDIWTTNPETYPYQMDWRSPEFLTGNLAADYEYTTPGTFVVHLRKDIDWQNIPPANGRQFIASDVVSSYQRLFGLGSGQPGSPFYSWYVQWQQLKSLTAPDNFTVVFQWAMSNTEAINELIDSADASNDIVCPEVINARGNMNDWHYAIGTGPFMVTDFVDGSSASLVKSPNYFAHDERYPQNQLPYSDKVSVLIIPDDATALAAMRSGKIDIMYGMSYTQAQDMRNSNPKISQISIPGLTADSIDMRNDKAPFSDIKVREALQMSINLQDISQNYYNGTTPPDPSTLSNNGLTGWGFPYSEWPQDLKDQYAFNVAGAKALLTAAGYSNGFNTDIVAPDNYDMTLLQIVKSDFAAINVNMTIRTMDTTAWTNYVRVTASDDAMSCGMSGLGLSFEPMFQLAVIC